VVVSIAAILSTLFGVGLVAAEFVPEGPLWAILPLTVFIVFWLIVYSRHWEWVINLGLLLVFGLAALGLLLGHSPVVLFAGIFLSLAGWDLAAFSSRLHLGGTNSDLHTLPRRHFLLLGLCLAAGTGLVLFALNLKFNIPFGWMILCALLAALGLGKLISSLLKIE
jgi:hypothetical protein